MAEEYTTIDSETYYQNVKRGIPSTLVENKFNRDGWSFKGWSTSSTGGVVQYSDKQSGVTFTADQHLYAVWELNSWTISYDMAGHGSVPSDALTTYNSSTSLPYYPPFPTSIAQNYIFMGYNPPCIPIGTTGNFSFNTNWNQYIVSDIGYKIVPIIDTSASMTDNYDKRVAFTTLVALISDYMFDNNGKSIFVEVYKGAFPSDTSTFSQLTSETISRGSTYNEVTTWNIIKENLKTAPDGESDEDMLAVFYKVISQIMDNITLNYFNGNTYNYDRISEKAITFAILTDEALQTSSYYRPKTTNLNKITSTWFTSWQQSALPIPYHSPFPFEIGGTLENRYNNMFKGINNALKQMSHYYGINFNMCVSGNTNKYFGSSDDGDSSTGVGYKINPYYEYIKDIIPTTASGIPMTNNSGEKTAMNGGGHNMNMSTNADYIFWDFTRGVVLTGNGSNCNTLINNLVTTNGYDWNNTNHRVVVPNSYHVSNISEPMCKINIIGAKLNTSKIMHGDSNCDDLHNENNLMMSKFHKKNDDWYFAFRYFNVNDSITLPTSANVVLPTGKTLSKWILMKKNNVTVEYTPGGTYNANKSDLISDKDNNVYFVAKIV